MTQNKVLNTVLKLIIVVAVTLIVLLGIYFAGNFVLPGMIKSNHQSKNCEQVLTLDSFYASAYPALIADKSIADLTKECALYTVAAEIEQKKSWQNAYNAYKTYKETYPKGLFIQEADEHSALILTAWAKEQLAAKQYTDAIGNINLVLNNFGATSAATEAASLISDVYMTWAKDQREASDFAGAETTLKAFSTWAEGAKKSDQVKAAQRELAQTYLAWGLAFQSQKQFDDSRAKLELAISTDPEPLAQDGPAAQAKTAKAALYTEWGDTLMAQNDFAGALDRYQSAIPLLAEKDQPAAKDRVAAVYLKWAEGLRATDDFLGALAKTDEAAKNSATEAGKNLVENAKADIYALFSKSTGRQAAQAMKDAIKDVCEKNKKPALPIFGLDKEHILASIYGIDDKFPENVIARTPGALHYVACVDIKTETVQTMDFYWAKFVREKYTWIVTLKKVQDPKSTAATSVEGGAPPSFPEINRSNYLAFLAGSSFYRSRGSNPDSVTLANWLLKTMK